MVRGEKVRILKNGPGTIGHQYAKKPNNKKKTKMDTHTNTLLPYLTTLHLVLKLWTIALIWG